MDGRHKAFKDQAVSEKSEGSPGHRANESARSNWVLALKLSASFKNHRQTVHFAANSYIDVRRTDVI
jgi:hypothetical protein